MSVIEEIKAQLDIVSVVSSYVHLEKKGNHFKALCPFHSEKTPSFVVFPDKQVWRCFGQCGDSGDIFAFVMKQENITFMDALQKLGLMAGIAPEKLSGKKTKVQVQHEERLYGILKEAATFYYEQLENSPAANYLAKRGLTNETAQHFLLGYSPDDWQTLYQHLLKLGYRDEDLEATGLIGHSPKSGKPYDRFRNRFMIPIFDPQGRVVGFGARALTDEQMPKYLNSPQSEVFDKSRLLYGLHDARRAIREHETVVVVEGYLDVIQAHQAGFKNVVGTMGTALTQDHMKLLSQYARKLVLALDTDQAGLKATMRGLEIAREALGQNKAHQVQDFQGITRQGGRLKMDISILRLPYGKDPDDFIRRYPEQWESEVAAAQPLADYLINLATADVTPNTSILERERIAEKLLPLLTATEDQQIKLHNLQRLSLELRLDGTALVALAMGKTSQTSAIPATLGRVKRYGNSKNKQVVNYQETNLFDPNKHFSVDRNLYNHERHCLALLLENPYRIYEVNRRLRELARDPDSELYIPLEEEDFTHIEFKAIYHDLAFSLDHLDDNPLEYFSDHLDPTLREIIEDILVIPLEVYIRQSRYMQVELEGYKNDDNVGLQPLIELRYKRIMRQCLDIYVLLKEAEERHDSEDYEKWTGYYQQVAPTLARFQSSLYVNLMKS